MAQAVGRRRAAGRATAFVLFGFAIVGISAFVAARVIKTRAATHALVAALSSDKDLADRMLSKPRLLPDNQVRRPTTRSTPAGPTTSEFAETRLSASSFTPAPASSPAPPAAVAHCDGDAESPANSETLIEGFSDGEGRVSVDNGNSQDAVVAIVNLRNLAVRRFYVRARTEGKARRIPPGRYLIRFALGTGYSAASGRFCRLVGAFEFDGVSEFTEFKTKTELRFSEYQFSLPTMDDGNLHARRISPELVFGPP